jgi:hypothetical protein
MTNQTFILKAWNGQTKTRRNNSLVFERMGNEKVLYSYGYHYPLLFTINGKTIRNVTGYSHTTAKHINLTRCVDAYDVQCGYGFHLYRGSDGEAKNAESLRLVLLDKITRLDKEIASKTRKDTKIYARLLSDLEDTRKVYRLIFED